MSDMTAVDARITGRVQGVSFRAWTCGEAQARGLSGWVRNEADGTVSAHFSGPADRVSEMVDALHRGPPAARVEAVQTQPAQTAATGTFEILR